MPNGTLGAWIFNVIVLGGFGWLIKKHFDADTERHQKAEKAIDDLRNLVIDQIKEKHHGRN